MTKYEIMLEEILANPEDREQYTNIGAGLYGLGRDRVIELLEEADKLGKKLVFYNDPEAEDKTEYKFE